MIHHHWSQATDATVRLAGVYFLTIARPPILLTIAFWPLRSMVSTSLKA